MEELLEVRNRLLTIFGLLVGCLLAGTAGYRVIEGWGFLDSLYMTVITLATVGYGEVHPLSAGGRVFTIVLILGGIGVMTYAFSTITSIIVEGELSAAFKRRRMQKEIDRLSEHYIICGGGHAGGVIAAELRKTGRPLVVIEKHKEVAEKFHERLGEDILIVEGDATEDETLKKAGVERAAGVFAVLATDQDNAFVALSAKGANPKARVVCCQKELGVREKLFRSGADNVVNPEFIGGLRMASEMIRPAAVGFLDSMIKDKDSVTRFEEIAVPEGSPFVGKALGAVKGAQGKAPLVVAVLEPGSGKYDINPEPERIISAGERLVLIGELSQLGELKKKIAA
ncbi:MAG: NAD-binding protein [Elusimicrobia bacterium]|nr:NAD-binding protein [Elusimicrobiota bacterium]